ncbi:hypothetical protein [Kitasatospora sp. NRRL B-11411]|uniref:hypothetical protein n=1 Tax=Kitasatospora sp. NRRL B-11411 TaxID=1463822 RepID=UPI0004C2C59E|nr:hypothetical protein [Kitasatospora sp. NRRL B-11411]WNW39976.1 hypothetical protein RKE32_21715 [Streptomyces sp. Li-HN-5-13]
MTGSEKPTVPGPRHAVPREGVRSRLRGRALAIAAVPTALLVGAAYTPTLAAAADPQQAGNCAPDTVLKETPVPKSEIKVLPDSSVQQAAALRQPGTGQAPAGSAAAVPAVYTGGAAAQSAVYTVPKAAAAPGGTVQQAGVIDDWWNNLIHPGASASPSPTPTPAPTAKSGTAAPTPTPAATPAPSGAPRSATAAPATTPAPTPSAGATASKGAAAKPSAAPSASPSPSASAPVGPNCLVSTRGLAAKAAPSGHVVPDQNWVLHSTRLALHGSVFNGVYDVTTESGTKRVLKFTTDSVDIENLDMSTIQIPGLTFHVKSREGSTSTMRNGPVTMYVESLSGNLAAVYGLPILIDLGQITLTPDTLPKWLWDLLGAVPIPLDLTLTNAKAVQAGQFGGDLTIPGMRLFNDKTPYDG